MATLTVDWKRCRGHSVCAAALGEVISTDQWGFPEMPNTVEVPDDLHGAARLAVGTCPAAALRLRRS